MSGPSGRLGRGGVKLSLVGAIGAVCSAYAAAQTVPAAGRYEATLCVSSASLAPSCGPAQVDVRPGGSVLVQVSDIVYRLRIRTGQAAVVVTQGTMQIDEFDAGAEWNGNSLRFADADKNVNYEVQIGGARRAPI
jgi:hypothetical protein